MPTYHDVGMGHLYQGRFRSFPVAEDEHFLTVCRYVERNALRADLVSRHPHDCAAWRQRRRLLDILLERCGRKPAPSSYFALSLLNLS